MRNLVLAPITEDIGQCLDVKVELSLKLGLAPSGGDRVGTEKGYIGAFFPFSSSSTSLSIIHSHFELVGFNLCEYRISRVTIPFIASETHSWS